jgi:hypothetical protein
MAKLSKEEADQLAALRAKEEAPDEPAEGDDGDDDGHVILLRGARADSFLAALLGPAKPAKKAAAKPATGTPASGKPEGDAAAEGDGDDQGEGETPPKPPNRYFR